MMHRVTRAAIATAAISLLALGGATAANAAPRIPLNNGQETTGAEGGAHGFLTYTIDGNQFCYTLSVRDLTAPATDAHIHKAPQGAAAPPVIPMGAPSDTSFMVEDCVTVNNAALLADIQENPRDYYVNVHTSTYPGGEVRGQLK
jgi:hypothetical protein